jgi:hypothetical protein
MSQVATPDARSTVSPPAQVGAGPDPLTVAIVNVTDPVAVPAERGRPNTTVFMVAGLPDFTKAGAWSRVLEVAFATGWVTEADEPATPDPPGYDTDTVYGPSPALSTPALTLQWVVLTWRPMTLLPE